MAPLKNIIRADLVWEVFKNLLFITVGSVLCAAATNGIIIPQKFISAGFTGLALSIFYFLPSLSVGWLYFFLNIPLFVLGWRFVGRRFLLYSIIGMLVFSAALYFVRVPFSIQDKLLSALLAGIISGAGSGIILRSAGSAGGLDILAVIMARSFSLRLGSTSLAFNSILLFTAGLMFSLESALYTLIYIFVTSYMVNLVVTGLSQRKSVFIISSRWKEIAEGIREEIQRGYTLISGRGGYTGQDEQILYTVITFRELHRLKTLIRQVDPNAFMVVHDTLEVMGHRIGNQPHW